MKKLIIALVMVCIFAIPALAEDKEVKGWYGTDLSAYGLNEHGQMVLILHDYIPQRFPQSLIRTFNLGTQVVWGSEMDAWLSPDGTGIWIVLYSNGYSHCGVLIGDFGF